MMLDRLLMGLLLAALAALSACSPQAKQAVANLGSGFGVTVGFKAVDMCQNISPPMTVTNVPAGTKKLKLRVLNFNFGTEIFNQDFGFETTSTGLYINGANAMIPKGALKGGQFPCPEQNPSTLSIQLKALDANNRELGNISVTHDVAPAPEP